jgi:hypothetical protein
MEIFYVKIKGVIFEVHGHRDDAEGWSVACEHSQFKATCIPCCNMLREPFGAKDVTFLS